MGSLTSLLLTTLMVTINLTFDPGSHQAADPIRGTHDQLGLLGFMEKRHYVYGCNDIVSFT